MGAAEALVSVVLGLAGSWLLLRCIWGPNKEAPMEQRAPGDIVWGRVDVYRCHLCGARWEKEEPPYSWRGWKEFAGIWLPEEHSGRWTNFTYHDCTPTRQGCATRVGIRQGSRWLVTADAKGRPVFTQEDV